jgi:hypothetical protein
MRFTYIGRHATPAIPSHPQRHSHVRGVERAPNWRSHAGPNAKVIELDAVKRPSKT